MSMFRAKKMDLGCFINVKVIRDHTKRKVFAEHEPERSVPSSPIPITESSCELKLTDSSADKH
jgi:hypothetical protein